MTLETIHHSISQHQRKEITQTGIHRAAVLVPLIQDASSLHLLLTKRTDSVEHHKGQISFPGGMAEIHDRSSIETALRETEEEIGISSSSITILGMLDDTLIPSGFIITPVVGYIKQLPTVRMNSDEVAEILIIPFDKFFDCSLRRSEIRELRGVQREVFFYDVWKEPVWGATAHIIKELTDLVKP